MLDVKYIIDNEKLVFQKLKSRNFDTSKIVNLVPNAKKLGKVMFDSQNLQYEIAKISKLIGQNKNDKVKVEQLKNSIFSIKNQLNELKIKQNQLSTSVEEMLNSIPNLPLDIVPIGNDENNNVLLVENANLGKGLVVNKISHDVIGNKLELFDLPRASKLSGARFVLYKNQGAKLIRALLDFMLDEHTARGYIEYNTPLLVKPEIMYGTGQLPKFEEDLFKLNGRDLYLISTAEVSLTNIWNNEIVNLEHPIKMCAFSECFRSEAGSGGKDTRGIIRNHQFKKVELVKITTKEQIDTEYKKTLDDVRNILNKLEIPYREIILCTGDIGFSSEQTIDFEIWMPSEFKYREISSVSRFGDFQGRRAKIRYKNNDNKNTYAYTINGSGLAIDRLIAAIIENNYDPKTNTVEIPKVLHKYFGNIKKLSKIDKV